MKISIILILLLIIGVAACGCLNAASPPAPSEVPSIMPQGDSSEGMPDAGTNASIPDLVGRWSGLTTGQVQGDGFFSHNSGVYTITEQQGYAFAGYKEYLRPDGNTYYENFSGAIASDGAVIFADSVKGYSIGRVTGPDSMELLYGEDGPEARAFIQFFTRETE